MRKLLLAAVASLAVLAAFVTVSRPARAETPPVAGPFHCEFVTHRGDPVRVQNVLNRACHPRFPFSMSGGISHDSTLVCCQNP